jgi:hypothetical protein
MSRLIPVLLCVAAVVPAALAEKAAPLSALAKMPVKEVTIFKDGHAFVMHAGKMPTNAEGNVEMDYLPTPVLGTFWPYSTNKQATLNSVTASTRKVVAERTALTVREMIEANVGADVLITEVQIGDPEKKGPPPSYRATIAGVPAQSGEELEELSPPNAGPKLPVKSNLVLLKLADGGTVVTSFDRIQNVTFLGALKPKVGQEEFRNLLTLKMNWADGKPQKEAELGLMYVQRGIRWIPNYKVTIDGKGKATVNLQATLINELTDLEDATCNLVVGVPSFQFKDMVDPMALQSVVARVAQALDENLFSNGQTQVLSNAIMTQTPGRARPVAREAQPGAAADLGPDVSGGEQADDLFVFTVNHVTLKKGQRMVLPVSEFTINYTDVYTLEVPFSPPADFRKQFNTQQQADVARLLNAPKAMHKVRLENTSKFPLTTAPALVVRENHVLGQSMMTYTSKGASVDLPVTTAVDVQVRKSERETKRVPNAMRFDGDQFMSVDAEGKITLNNFRSEPVKVEVTRYVLGSVGEVDQGGKVDTTNTLEDGNSVTFVPGNYPAWWSWYSWPSWWGRVNGTGRIQWSVTVTPEKPVELSYKWKYFWR